MIRNFIWPLIEFIGSYIFIMSLIVPVNPYSDEIHDYVFNVTYVNGDCKDILVNLPEDFKYGISNNKGSYYLEFTSEGKTIWGYKSIFEYEGYGDISGVLYVNTITKK